MVNDGIGNGNFTTLKPFAFWTQHVLPLVYGDEISYMETLGKMRDILNELIKNNNNLPTYIQQMIEEYISSGAIEEVIDKILSNFILNVKYPPAGVPKAKGDGTTNDHDSIQGCIDYASGLGGGVVYLPSGKYLTSSLVLKPGVTLLGFGRYATSLILNGGATTHLITGTVSDAGLLNLTLNAKMSSQVNRIDAVELVGNHIDIRNCIVKDCYTSINVQKTGSAINICDVICEVASDACLRIGGTDGGLLVDGLEMTGLSTNLGVAYLVTDSNGDVYRNINIHGTGAVGIDVSGSKNYFDGKISGVTKDYEDLSGDNSFELFGKSSVKVYNDYIDRQAANIRNNASNAYIVNAKDVVLNPTNQLTYKTPTPYNSSISYIEFKDSNNNIYKIPTFTGVFSTLPVYIATDYNIKGDGVTDNRASFYALFDIINANGGGTVILPSGTYNVSDCVFIPENTNLIGEGYESFVFLNASSSELGAALATGGNNITVNNIRVGFLNDNQPITGTVDLTGLAMTSYPYSRGKNNDFSVSENYSNLHFDNIFCTGRNALQNEPAATGSISNFSYTNIYAPNASVTISGTHNSMTNYGFISNILCSLFRIGFGDNGSLGINVENIKTFYCRILENNINVNNLLVIQDSDTNLIYRGNNYTEALLTFGKGIKISNAVITGNKLSKTLYGIENNEGQPEPVYYSNVKAYNFINSNYHSSSGIDNNLVNCDFSDSSNTPSVLYGDCINVKGTFDTQAKFSVYNNVMSALLAYDIGWTNTSGTYPSTYYREGKLNVLKILATYTGTDFVNNKTIGTIPLSVGIPSVKKFVSGSLYKAGEFIYYTIVLEIGTDGTIKIFDTGITKTDFDTLIVDAIYLD